MQNTISKISTYFPEKELPNEELAKEFPNMKLRELTRLTGVYSRHISADNETSVDMGVKAAFSLFESGVDRSNIDMLIFCSAGGDYITPPSACIIHDRLGLPANCGAFDFNQGCTGYIYGLNIADSLITANNASNVLLITSEAITKTIHPGDGSNRAIFGDGATASLITKAAIEKVSSGFVFGTDGSKHEKIIIKHGRERFPILKNAVEDDNQDNVKNPANFYMDGSEVFNFSIAKAPELVMKLLQKANISMDDIDYFVFHQANRIIVETIGKKLKIPDHKLVIDIETTGNTVSSTIPIVLKNGIENKMFNMGDKILIAGFGVGFSWGGTIMTL